MRAPDQQLAQDDAAPIRPLHSLRETHAEAVRAALAATASAWVVERLADYDGDMNLLITLPDPSTAPTYILSGTQEGICLALVEDDCWKTLHRVDTLAQAIDLLQEIINEPSQTTHTKAA